MALILSCLVAPVSALNILPGTAAAGAITLDFDAIGSIPVELRQPITTALNDASDYMFNAAAGDIVEIRQNKNGGSLDSYVDLSGPNSYYTRHGHNLRFCPRRRHARTLLSGIQADHW
jgi:hypothetical protein